MGLHAARRRVGSNNAKCIFIFLNFFVKIAKVGERDEVVIKNITHNQLIRVRLPKVRNRSQVLISIENLPEMQYL